MSARWQTGVATVERSDARHVYVRCPHCSMAHVHGRGLVGSRNVVAGCHVGFGRCLEYAIPDLGGRFSEKVPPGAFAKRPRVA